MSQVPHLSDQRVSDKYQWRGQSGEGRSGRERVLAHCREEKYELTRCCSLSLDKNAATFQKVTHLILLLGKEGGCGMKPTSPPTTTPAAPAVVTFECRWPRTYPVLAQLPLCSVAKSSATLLHFLKRCVAAPAPWGIRKASCTLSLPVTGQEPRLSPKVLTQDDTLSMLPKTTE